MTTSRAHVIVLAAGKGTRMKSDLAKVLHLAAGRPMLSWVMDSVAAVEPFSTVVVVGYQADEVAATIPAGAVTAVQAEQRGTGHAALVGLGAVEAAPGDTVLVVLGDMPLVTGTTLRRVLEHHETEGAAATMVVTELPDPTGYGRVVRQGDRVVRIVEERDADPATRAIREVNTSIYAFDAEKLGRALGSVGSDNDQGEMYLTDVIEILAGSGDRIVAVDADPIEVMGVNSHDQLADAAKQLRSRINRHWMREGVWMADPDRTYIDAGVVLEAGAKLFPDVYLEGATTVGAGAEIGPSVYARDSEIGPGAKVWYAVMRQASVGAHAEVGPYVSLRPDAELLESSKAGTFVEIKASTVGRGSKVPHLSYIGDTTIGEKSNIGAGTITVNYDGFEKHRTIIGDRVRIGSDTMLVAPIEIGDDAYTGAGSVISKDVAPGALAVERSQQKEIPGYAAKRERRAREERE